MKLSAPRISDPDTRHAGRLFLNCWIRKCHSPDSTQMLDLMKFSYFSSEQDFIYKTQRTDTLQ